MQRLSVVAADPSQQFQPIFVISAPSETILEGDRRSGNVYCKNLVQNSMKNFNDKPITQTGYMKKVYKELLYSLYISLYNYVNV